MVDPEQSSRLWMGWMAPTTRDALLALGRLKEFPAGTLLVKEGGEPASSMIIQSGLVAVNRSGHEEHGIFLTFRGPNELVGEIGVIHEQPRIAEVLAMPGDRVRVWWYEARQFRAFLNEHPDARIAVERAALRKFLVHQERCTRYGRGDALHRVAHVLLDYMADFGQVGDDGLVGIAVPLTQQRIADLVGFSTDAVGAAFKKLSSACAIRTSSGRSSRTRILDKDVLVYATRT